MVKQISSPTSCRAPGIFEKFRLRRTESRGIDWLIFSRKGFGGKSCPMRPAKTIEVKGHNETVGRYGHNQWSSWLPIFLIFVVHNLSPNHQTGSNSPSSAIGAISSGSAFPDRKPE